MDGWNPNCRGVDDTTRRSWVYLVKLLKSEKCGQKSQRAMRCRIELAESYVQKSEADGSDSGCYFHGPSDLRTLNVQHKLSFISIFISKIRLGKRPAFQTPFDYASNCKYFHVGIHALMGVGACRVARTIHSNERKAGTKGRLGVPMFTDPCPKQPSMKTGFSLA